MEPGRTRVAIPVSLTELPNSYLVLHQSTASPGGVFCLSNDSDGFNFSPEFGLSPRSPARDSGPGRELRPLETGASPSWLWSDTLQKTTIWMMWFVEKWFARNDYKHYQLSITNYAWDQTYLGQPYFFKTQFLMFHKISISIDEMFIWRKNIKLKFEYCLQKQCV